MIEIGKKAPAFHIADGDGEKHRLSSYTEHHVVLYFYPKDDTSGCTKEAWRSEICTPNFRAWMRGFWGESRPGGVACEVCGEVRLNFPLLADEKDDEGTRPVREVWRLAREEHVRQEVHGGGPDHLPDRSRGKVLQRWDKVKVPGHAEAVLAAIQEDQSNG